MPGPFIGHKRSLGYVLQEPSLFPHLTVRQNLRYGTIRRRADATVVDELRIEWTDGTVTMLESVPVDQRIVIGQPEIGDLDGDGLVGFADLSGLLGRWGACPPYPDTCLADLDCDGEVGFNDLTNLLGHWG